MGLDRFANFISKSINNEGIEDININQNIRKIVSSHVIFDLNFIIYQEIIEIENEINDILKTILCLPFSTNQIEKLEEIIKNIFTQPHWKPYYVGTNLENIFDGFNEDEIIKNFISYITSKISSSNTESNQNKNDGLTILELVIYEKIVNVLYDYIDKLHQTSFIQNLTIFFDGIPSFSKVIEQRRRRLKNYFESNEKKLLFKKYFDNLLTSNQTLNNNLSKTYDVTLNSSDDFLFDYFKWVKHRFSIDKSIGPSSNFIKNLELFMNIKIKQFLPKIKITINSAKENGESDLKIFKYISCKDNNGDYCIHTTDSDLIHQILVQQTYYKVVNKDINFMVVKYLKNFNMVGYAQIIDSNLIIKNILDLYNNINNIKTNNYKIIWDLCFIFYLFGNDHLPSSTEIGPELGLEYFLKVHYNSLNKTNLINLKKSHVTLDLKNLALILKKINETKDYNITKIILQRFFKINQYTINILVDKLNLNFSAINNFLKTFILHKASLLSPDEINNLDSDDLRKILFSQVPNPEDFKDLKIFGFDEQTTKILQESMKTIEDNIDYYEKDFMGLIIYNKPMNITKDPYQDLYNFICEKANTNLYKKYPELYDHIDVNDHLKIIDNSNDNDPNDFLKKIYHLTITQFGNMQDYHTDNLTWYKYKHVPSIDNLIKFIEQDENKTKVWLKEILEENIDTDKYLNSINHHLLITPFISSYVLPDEIKNIIGELEPIDNLWIDQVDKFDYRKIDIKKFFNVWSEALIKINLNTKSSKINSELVNLNLSFI